MKSTLSLGSHGDEVKEWQHIIGAETDGKFGLITQRLTLQWQELHHVHVDGVVGEETWGKALGNLAVPKKKTQQEYQNSIAAVTGIDKLSKNDLLALVYAAREIITNPDYLAAVISFETRGTFSPSVPNSVGSGAVGLIQFMPKTAKALGTSSEELCRMTFQEQLDYVVKYFKSFNASVSTLRGLYLAVFFPTAMDEEDDYVIAKLGTKVYEQNIGFDTVIDGKRKGYITRNDVCLVIDNVLKQSDTKERIFYAKANA